MWFLGVHCSKATELPPDGQKRKEIQDLSTENVLENFKHEMQKFSWKA